MKCYRRSIVVAKGARFNNFSRLFGHLNGSVGQSQMANHYFKTIKQARFWDPIGMWNQSCHDTHDAPTILLPFCVITKSVSHYHRHRHRHWWSPTVAIQFSCQPKVECFFLIYTIFSLSNYRSILVTPTIPVGNTGLNRALTGVPHYYLPFSVFIYMKQFLWC